MNGNELREAMLRLLERKYGRYLNTLKQMDETADPGMHAESAFHRAENLRRNLNELLQKELGLEPLIGRAEALRRAKDWYARHDHA